jgi:integrase
MSMTRCGISPRPRHSSARGPSTSTPPERALPLPPEPSFPHRLQAYFTERRLHQRHASPPPIARSRPTFCLLLQFAPQQLPKAPASLSLAARAAPFLSALLEHLEPARGNRASSRHARLAALPALFHYAALSAPQYSAVIHRVLAIPSKRTEQTASACLPRPAIAALLEAPSQATWAGRRDRTFLLSAGQTGLRVSALTAWRGPDVVLGAGAHVPCSGKGRKQRCPPLRQEAGAA